MQHITGINCKNNWQKWGQFLKKFGEVQIASSSRGIEPSTIQTNERVEVEE
jgi:hypothetical protein